MKITKSGLRQIVRDEIQNLNEFEKGQLVKDINPDCPHVGSEGEVTKVTKDEVTYTVRNNGENYKVGDELTKTKDQLTSLSLEASVSERAGTSKKWGHRQQTGRNQHEPIWKDDTKNVKLKKDDVMVWDKKQNKMVVIKKKEYKKFNKRYESVNEAKKKVDIASLSVGNTYKDSKGYPVKIVDIGGSGNSWKITYQDGHGKKKTVKTSLDKGINLYEYVNEGNLPSNIQKWIRDRGPEPSKDVKMIGKWVKKLTGREISGGVAIGKNYNTLVLDIGHQDAAIHYDTTSGDIKLYKKKIRSFNDFKKVFQAAGNKSVNEGVNASDLKYQMKMSLDDSGIGTKALIGMKPKGKDYFLKMKSYMYQDSMDNVLKHVNSALNSKLKVKNFKKTRAGTEFIIGESVNEAKELSPNQDLKINGALVSMLKRAGFQVKSFKATKKGYNEMWSGEFKTKNAILPMSVNKHGNVFYQDTNIGRIDKSSKIIDWMKNIKHNAPWTESLNEASPAPDRDLFRALNAVNNAIFRIMIKYQGKADLDAGFRSWMLGLHAKLKKVGIKL